MGDDFNLDTLQLRVNIDEGLAYIRSNDPMSSVLKGHLVVEAMLTEAIEERVEPASLKQLNLNHFRLVTLAAGLKLIRPADAAYLLELNRIRNELAHNLKGDITEATQARLVAAMAPGWRGVPDVQADLAEPFPQPLTMCLVVALSIGVNAIHDERSRKQAMEKARKVMRKIVNRAQGRADDDDGPREKNDAPK